ncbi:MAG: ParB/RepB/Spo0J family partition protein [Planctomycetaceae bacterium]|nr:ParB/RepB/Spo0J family partition protein [Planctomycetaceae bacterium]
MEDQNNPLPSDNVVQFPSNEEPGSDGFAGGIRRRLGRGLTSLLGQVEAVPQAPQGVPLQVTNGDAELIHIDVNQIERNPYQPRKDFDLQALNELSESIAEHGVLQPLLVRKMPNGTFQLIAGERRWLASRDAGLATVPCRVMAMEEKVVSEVAIIENLQREDLNELEKAQAFQAYLDQYGCTIEELARKMGKDRSTISNSLRLLELPNFVKEALRNGKISAGHARSLLPLEEESDQIAMCQRIQSEGLSVRATEQAVRDQLAEKEEATIPLQNGATGGKKTGSTKISNHVASLQDQLREVVGVKVEIKLKGKDAGRMIIHFNSTDEFDRIVQHLRKAG